MGPLTCCNCLQRRGFRFRGSGVRISPSAPLRYTLSAPKAADFPIRPVRFRPQATIAIPVKCAMQLSALSPKYPEADKHVSSDDPPASAQACSQNGNKPDPCLKAPTSARRPYVARSAKSRAVADLPIGARRRVRHHSATAKQYCPSSSAVARHFSGKAERFRDSRFSRRPGGCGENRAGRVSVMG